MVWEFRIWLNNLPFSAAYTNAKLFLSSTAFTFAPLSMSSWTIFSNPRKEWWKYAHNVLWGCIQKELHETRINLPLSAACINAVLPFSPIMFKSAPFWMSNSESLSNPVHTIKTLKNVSKQNVISYIWMIPRLRAMINTESTLTTLISAPFSMSSLIIPSCAMSLNWKHSIHFISLLQNWSISGMYLTMLPFKAAMMSAELFLSFTTFMFAPFSMSIRTILSKPINNWMNWLKLHFFRLKEIVECWKRLSIKE